MGLSKSEQETVIRIAEDESSWNVFTEAPRMLRSLSKLQALGVVTMTKDGQGVRCTVPRNFIRIKIPRKMSENQRAAVIARGFGKKKSISENAREAPAAMANP